jgi:hypothetical protein
MSRPLLVVAAGLATSIFLALVTAPAGYAGFAVQPADGSTLTSGNPTFLVYIDDGETLPQVEVSTSAVDAVR